MLEADESELKGARERWLEDFDTVLVDVEVDIDRRVSTGVRRREPLPAARDVIGALEDALKPSLAPPRSPWQPARPVSRASPS